MISRYFAYLFLFKSIFTEFNPTAIFSNTVKRIFYLYNHIILLLVKTNKEWYNMNIDKKNEEIGGSEMNTAKVKTTTPTNKRVSKEKRDELYKKLTEKNKEIYRKLAK